jgi:hypothetical protein
METSKRLKIYEFFGVTFREEKDSEILADCPFCGKEKHFYINKENALFDCKRCIAEGNYTDFLTLTYDQIKDFNEELKIKELAEYRNLPYEAFLGTGIIYTGNRYWIPIWNGTDKIVDIRHYYKGKNVLSTDGVSLGIFNFKELVSKERLYDPVYICEGEFDAIALNYLLRKVKKTGVVIGIPGAGIFKKEWQDYFLGRDIIVCYDNDSAGNNGYVKVRTELIGKARSIKQLIWPAEMPTGYDVNNFVAAYGVRTGQYESCYEMLQLLTKSEDKTAAVLEKKYESIPNNTTFKELLVEYKKSLEINQEYEDAIRIMLATIISINIPGPDPVWLFFVGPPGCGKTALLNTARNSDLCYYQSSLGRHSLISGWKTPSGADPSILAHIKNKCFILKDFTEVLFKSQTDRDEIFSILRGAFDGSVERKFGNNVTRVYSDLRFSMIAGVTQEINNYPQASAGERFLRYNFNSTEDEIEKQQEAALSQLLVGEVAKQDLQVYVRKFINQTRDFSQERLSNYFTNEFRNRLKPLARLAAYLRTPVIRYERGRKNECPVYEPIPETGNRIAVQLQRLAFSLAILENKETIDRHIFKILKKVAFDTVQSYASRIIDTLYKAEKLLIKQEIAERINFNPNYLTPYLEDLCALKMIDRKDVFIKGSSKTTWGYLLTPTIFELINKVEEI